MNATAPMLVLASLALAGLNACETLGHECTAIGCANAVTVSLVGRGGARLPDGHYVVTARAGGDVATCALDQPLSSASSCALAAAVARLDDFTPAHVSITVTHDGEPVAAVSDLPVSYITSRPNGPGCGPVCKRGKVEVIVPNR